MQASGITLRVDVWDDDYNIDDKIDRCRVTINNLIPGQSYGRDCNGERSVDPTTLRLEYTLTCSDGFGGPDCAKFCENPPNGICDFSLPHPHIRCKENWRGPPECDLCEKQNNCLAIYK